MSFANSRESATPSDVSCYTPSAAGSPTPDTVPSTQAVDQITTSFPASAATHEAFRSPGRTFANCSPAPSLASQAYREACIPTWTGLGYRNLASTQALPTRHDPSVSTFVSQSPTHLPTSEQIGPLFSDQIPASMSPSFSQAQRGEPPFSFFHVMAHNPHNDSILSNTSNSIAAHSHNRPYISENSWQTTVATESSPTLLRQGSLNGLSVTTQEHLDFDTLQDKENLGLVYPSNLTSISNLTEVLHDLSKDEAVEAMQRRTFNESEKVLEPKYPSMLPVKPGELPGLGNPDRYLDLSDALGELKITNVGSGEYPI